LVSAWFLTLPEKIDKIDRTQFCISATAEAVIFNIRNKEVLNGPALPFFPLAIIIIYFSKKSIVLIKFHLL